MLWNPALGLGESKETGITAADVWYVNDMQNYGTKHLWQLKPKFNQWFKQEMTHFFCTMCD